MKNIFKILLFTFFFKSFTFSQEDLTKAQVLDDFKVFKTVLTKGHPGLYEYTTPKQWNSLFAKFEDESIKNKTDLYKSLTNLSDHVRDGHLIVMRPQLDSIPNLFPLLIKIIESKLYTDTDDFGIPVGSEIISIDDRKGPELRNMFLKYAPSDGYNTTKKDRQVEREFGILHFYEFGPKYEYKIEYITPSNQLFTKNIKSQPFETIGHRFKNRNSYFSLYHSDLDKTSYVKKMLSREEPFLYSIDSLNAAVLTLNSFAIDTELFQSKLKDIFKELKRKKVKNLIIDIRQNKGGYPLNAINAFSYITSGPFKQRKSSEVVTSSLPEKQYSKNLVNGFTYEKFFEKYYKNNSTEEKKWVLTTDENESFMVSNKKGFEGNIYVLIGGKTFSAGSSFALFCKNAGIQLIGEETGGGYYTQNGGYPILYTLPHSEIKILVPFVKINRYVQDYSIPKGNGIIPNVPITLTVQDLIQGKDSQLDYVLNQINVK